jgi:hypothetical protein
VLLELITTLKLRQVKHLVSTALLGHITTFLVKHLVSTALLVHISIVKVSPHVYLVLEDTSKVITDQFFALNNAGQEAMEHMKVLLIIPHASLALPGHIPLQELLTVVAVHVVNFRGIMAKHFVLVCVQ